MIILENDYIGIIKYFTLKGLTAVEILKELESTLGTFILSPTIVEEMVVYAQNYLGINRINEEVIDNKMTDCQLKKRRIQEKKEEKMENSDYYEIIKYFTLKGLNINDIYDELRMTLKELYVIPSLLKIQEVTDVWKKYVGLNRMCKIVTDIVINDCQLTLEEIAKIIKIRSCFISFILKERGWMQLSGHWMPSVLTNDLRDIRVQVSKDCLKFYMDNQEDFMCRFVTFYETSFYYTPGMKQFAINNNSSSKTETIPSSKKVTAIIFWNSTGLVLIKYTQNIETISKDYLLMLEYLKTAIMQRQPQVANKTLIFQQVNTHPTYISRDAIQIHHDMQHQLLPHPPYSPDLAASNFHLLPNLKKWLANQKFTSYEEVQLMVNSYFLSVPKCEYESSILRLKYRWHYCIHLQGNYLQL